MTDIAAASAAAGPRSKNAVLLVDLENLIGGVHEPSELDLSLTALLAAIERSLDSAGLSSRFAVRRVYANWSDRRLYEIRKEMQKLALEPVQIFSFGAQQANAADIELVCDALALAAERPGLDTFVVVSADGGYVPMLRRLHLFDRTVVVFATNLPSAGRLSRLLPAAADHFEVLDLLPLVEEPAVSPPAKRPAATPATVPELVREIKVLLQVQPTLLRDGEVDAARLGNELRKQIGSAVWKDLGYDTITPLLQQNGWQIWRPTKAIAEARSAISPEAAPQPAEGTVAAFEQAASRALEVGSALAASIARDPDGVAAQTLITAIEDVPDGVPFGSGPFQRLETAVRYGLRSLPYTLVRRRAGLRVVADEAVVDGDQAFRFTDEELRSPTITREVLGTAEPRMTMPTPEAISAALLAIEDVRGTTPAKELILLLGHGGVATADARKAFALLTGLHLLDWDPETDTLAPGAPQRRTPGDGRSVVVRDLRRRAAATGWPVDDELLAALVGMN